MMLLLTGFGLGRLRRAPGTFGSLPPVVLVLLLLVPWSATQADSVNTARIGLVNAALGGLLMVFAAACAWFGGKAEARLGKDPQVIVADEIAGQSMVLIGLPWRVGTAEDALPWNLGLAVAAFASFRLFDIVKPAPARLFEALRGGWGVLADDLIAALYALSIMQFTSRVLLPLVLRGGEA